jgi:hypothetical protein
MTLSQKIQYTTVVHYIRTVDNVGMAPSVIIVGGRHVSHTILLVLNL